MRTTESSAARQVLLHEHRAVEPDLDPLPREPRPPAPLASRTSECRRRCRRRSALTSTGKRSPAAAVADLRRIADDPRRRVAEAELSNFFFF